MDLEQQMFLQTAHGHYNVYIFICNCTLLNTCSINMQTVDDSAFEIAN